MSQCFNMQQRRHTDLDLEGRKGTLNNVTNSQTGWAHTQHQCFMQNVNTTSDGAGKGNT